VDLLLPAIAQNLKTITNVLKREKSETPKLAGVVEHIDQKLILTAIKHINEAKEKWSTAIFPSNTSAQNIQQSFDSHANCLQQLVRLLSSNANNIQSSYEHDLVSTLVQIASSLRNCVTSISSNVQSIINSLSPDRVQTRKVLVQLVDVLAGLEHISLQLLVVTTLFSTGHSTKFRPNIVGYLARHWSVLLSSMAKVYSIVNH